MVEDLETRLRALDVHINAPEPALICCRCKYALQSSRDGVSKHLWERHREPLASRRGLTSLIKSLGLPDPNTLPLRQDGSGPHSYLDIHSGAACKLCSFRSTSLELVCRHLAKGHRYKGSSRDWVGDKIDRNVHLQSWTQNGSRGY